MDLLFPRDLSCLKTGVDSLEESGGDGVVVVVVTTEDGVVTAEDGLEPVTEKKKYKMWRDSNRQHPPVTY